jgi:hypothetical protein
MLFEREWRVRMLTNHPRAPDPFGGVVEVRPLDFSRGADVQNALSEWLRHNADQAGAHNASELARRR